MKLAEINAGMLMRSLLMLMLLFTVASLYAHQGNSAVLVINDYGEFDYHVTWKVAEYLAEENVALPEFPGDCLLIEGSHESVGNTSIWELSCESSLVNRFVVLPDLSDQITGVGLYFRSAKGDVSSFRSGPEEKQIAIAPREAYLTVVQQILTGFKQLLMDVETGVFVFLIFVFAWKYGSVFLIKMLLLFAVTYGLMLNSYAAGWHMLSGVYLQIMVVLSIMVYAGYVYRYSLKGVSPQKWSLWLVPVVFGGLQGVGLANDVSDMEPKLSQGWAFQAGIEIGLVCLMILLMLSARLSMYFMPLKIRVQVLQTSVYMVGAIASLWFFQRLALT